MTDGTLINPWHGGRHIVPFVIGLTKPGGLASRHLRKTTKARNIGPLSGEGFCFVTLTQQV
jgi:hypothetical protein